MDRYYEARFMPDPARAEVWGHVADYLHRWVGSDGDLLDLAAG